MCISSIAKKWKWISRLATFMSQSLYNGHVYVSVTLWKSSVHWKLGLHNNSDVIRGDGGPIIILFWQGKVTSAQQYATIAQATAP